MPALYNLPMGASDSLMRLPPRGKTVTPAALAEAFEIPVNRILALADAGYLCTVHYPKHTRDNYPVSIIRPPAQIVGRSAIMAWLTGLDEGLGSDHRRRDGRRIPVFSRYVEREIMRIAAMPEPVRTEQAIRLALRYRDAEILAEVLMKASAATIENIARLRKNEKLKHRLRIIAGLELSKQSRQAQEAQARMAPVPRTGRPSSRPIPSNGHSGRRETLPPSEDPAGNPRRSRTVRG